MNNLKAITSSYERLKKARKEFFINGVLFFVSDPLPDGVDPNNVKRKIEKKIPKKLFQNLDYIFVGDFPELKLRDVQSVYMRGAIYINHENQTEEGLYKAIIHELAHSIETTFSHKIYEDNEVAAEFVGKRKQLRSILKTAGYELNDPSIFLRTEYNADFDKFLYQTVGYDKLNQLVTGLFASPYAGTSLREYFANGFEYFFLEDPSYILKISPKLYKKINALTSK